jgi:NAD(P)-dependent dehydrogenase (short-subunit alcohol dehydrogenase family)
LAWARDSRQRHRACNRRCRVRDVPARSRHRVAQKYKIAYSEDESTESLRSKLAEFYAQRTITRRPILPDDCANAICFLAGDLSARTTGHVIPVDGGLPEAFLR